MTLSSDDLTPTLTGSLSRNLSSGEALRIYSGASFLGNASVKRRRWVFTPDSNLATNRAHSFSARVADAAGNLGTPSNTRRLTVDSDKPSVSISSDTTGTATGPVTYSFSFSEDVSGFSADHISVTGGTKQDGSFSGSGDTYSIVVTPTDATSRPAPSPLM